VSHLSNEAFNPLCNHFLRTKCFFSFLTGETRVRGGILKFMQRCSLADILTVKCSYITSVKSPDAARFDIMLCLTRFQSLFCETQRRSGLHIVLFLTEEEYRSCLFLLVLIMFFVWWKVKLTLLHYGVASKESRSSKRAVSPDRGVAKQRGTFLLLADLEHSESVPI